jgi:hypothetical protein
MQKPKRQPTETNPRAAGRYANPNKKRNPGWSINPREIDLVRSESERTGQSQASIVEDAIRAKLG